MTLYVVCRWCSGSARIRPPYYRRASPKLPPKHFVQEEFMNAGDASGSGARLYDYMQMGEMAMKLPIAERIAFVNPYERAWSRFEKTWHRDWHPRLVSPRRAWNVPVIPSYFDSLDYYKYITKTRVVDGLDQWYDELRPSTLTYGSLLMEEIGHHLDSSIPPGTTNIPALLCSVLDNGLLYLSQNVKHVRESRISYTSRCESFWIRGGFLSLYDREKEPLSNEVIRDRRGLAKFIGDDRRRLGELAFVVRDSFAASLRSHEAVNPLFALKSAETELPVFDENRDGKSVSNVIYSPKVFNMWPDADPLWMCAGYEPESGETQRYGRLALKDSSPLDRLCEYWKLESGEETRTVRREALTSAAVVSLFSWMNAQAHSIGSTQYNDLTSPLVSQLVLSNGREFFFAIGQLNTIAINVDVDVLENKRSNVVYVEGPFALYDERDENGTFYSTDEKGRAKEGFNEHVLRRLLQMIMFRR